MEQIAPDGVDGRRPFTVHVFGHTTVFTPDRTLGASDFTGVKPRQILELIALGRGEPVRKTVIAEHIWSGRPPRRWQVTLESYVALLRRALQPGVPGRATVLSTTPGGYRFDTRRVGIDVDDFESLIRRAAHTAPEEALPLWESAVEVADGTLLATEPYAAWAVDARRSHERALHAAAATGAEVALALREAGRAVALARRATELDPLAEHGWQLLIRAELAAGRRAEAAHAFHTCRASLRRDLGLEPDLRTRELFAGVLAGHGV
jgi:DNA-binding SARP family transcriptional activator